MARPLAKHKALSLAMQAHILQAITPALKSHLVSKTSPNTCKIFEDGSRLSRLPSNV